MCRALPHGKECVDTTTHGIFVRTAKAQKNARQTTTHGKGSEKRTAKSGSTAIIHLRARQREEARQRRLCAAVAQTLPCGITECTAKHPFPCVMTPCTPKAPLPCFVFFDVRKISFLSSFLSILFFVILIFIFSISFIFC
jgi:hypothetical protein